MIWNSTISISLYLSLDIYIWNNYSHIYYIYMLYLNITLNACLNIKQSIDWRLDLHLLICLDLEFDYLNSRLSIRYLILNSSEFKILLSCTHLSARLELVTLTFWLFHAYWATINTDIDPRKNHKCIQI